MFYEVSPNFDQKLADRFNEAIDNNYIEFNGSSAENTIVHKELGQSTVDFQFTLLKSLTRRPDNGSVESNPFAKPEPELTIEENFGPDNEFRIVFNKFPVVPKHFMLITKEFKSQNTPLSSTELAGSFSLLHSLRDTEKNWFAFYNCGPESGASQPHKHIQFMSLPDEFIPYPQTLAQKSPPFIPDVKQEPLQNEDIPFAHFVARFPDNSTDLEEDDLTMYFSSLLQRTLTVLRENNANHISYNVILTTSYMMLVPRSLGKYKDLGVNSCGFMGLFLCKNQKLLNLVNEDSPEAILNSCGYPSTAGESTDEYHY